MEIKKYLERATSKYRGHPSWDDAVQEGCIKFWRDSTETDYDLNHRQALAVMRAKSILFQMSKNKANYTGSTPKVSGAYVRKSGDATRKKISEFVSSFESIHNREPSQAEICRGTGLKRSTVSDSLKRAKIQGASVEAKDIQLQTWDASNYEQSMADERSAISWEDDTISRLVVEPLMGALPETDRRLIYGTFWLQMTSSELSQELGIGKTAIQRRIKKVLGTMQSAVNRDEYIN